MTVKLHEVPIRRYIGASTDTKPTTIVSKGTTSEVPIGSTFYEYDTELLYITYDGTNWVRKGAIVHGRVKTVSVTKALVGGACIAGDVLSESTTAGAAWTFAAIAGENGGSGYITKVHAILETAAKTPRLVVFLFIATPTCTLNDNAPNTALLHTDLANYVGKVDLPAMETIPAAGAGDSEAVATPSTTGSLPLAFTCASGADDLYAVVATRDAVTPTATDDLVIRLTVEQY